MRLRLPGVPFVLDMNGSMLAGTVVFLVGAAGYVAAEYGAFGEVPPGEPSRFGSLFFGVTVAGMALYCAGRIVQLVAHFRKPRP